MVVRILLAYIKVHESHDIHLRELREVQDE
jgi:hypothetical protein